MGLCMYIIRYHGSTIKIPLFIKKNIIFFQMAPNRFHRDKREKREVTPFTDETVVPDIPPEWRDLEAPINFTWVVQDELAGMGWPKSRDQV